MGPPTPQTNGQAAGCFAGYVAGGAAVGGVGGATAGGLIGGGGGTLVAPGVGTIGGGVEGALAGGNLGAQIGAVGGGVVGSIMCSNSGGGGGGSKLGSNQRQNKQAGDALKDAERRTGIKADKWKEREFHDAITGRNITSYQNLVDIAEQVLRGQ